MSDDNMTSELSEVLIDLWRESCVWAERDQKLSGFRKDILKFLKECQLPAGLDEIELPDRRHLIAKRGADGYEVLRRNDYGTHIEYNEAELRLATLYLPQALDAYAKRLKEKGRDVDELLGRFESALNHPEVQALRVMKALEK